MKIVVINYRDHLTLGVIALASENKLMKYKKKTIFILKAKYEKKKRRKPLMNIF